MNNSALAAGLTEALEAAAARDVGAAAPMVSLTVNIVTEGGVDTIEAAIARRTRTLLFVNAEAKGGERVIATAASVHKIPGAV